MATILELAELAYRVYGDAPTSTSSAWNSDWSALMSNWKPLLTSKSNPDGYYGVAYINTTTQEIVIANRGTVIDGANYQDATTTVANLLNDAELIAHEITPDEKSAITFAKEVAKYVLPGAQYAGYSLIETGHSLGGSEAQAATAALVDGTPSVAVSAATFQSPGITSQLFNKLPRSYHVLNLLRIPAIPATDSGLKAATHSGATLPLDRSAATRLLV